MESLEGPLRELAALAGASAAGFENEHDRWRLYQTAAEIPAARAPLWSAIAAEPVPAVASAAVVMLLEWTDGRQRDQLVGLLDPAVREFPAKRVRELEIFESICDAGDSVEIDADSLENWSDWLQLKVANSCRSPRVLALLSEHGRTKRIRRLAQHA